MRKNFFKKRGAPEPKGDEGLSGVQKDDYKYATKRLGMSPKQARQFALRPNQGIGNDAIEDEIAEGMAQAFWEGSYAYSEALDSGEEPTLSDQGADGLTDFIIDFGSQIVKANNCSLSECYERAEEAFERSQELAKDAEKRWPGKWRGPEKKPTPELFGHYIAMQAMGHGVGWNDWFPMSGVVFPNAEAHFYVEEDEGYYEFGEVDTRFMNEI